MRNTFHIRKVLLRYKTERGHKNFCQNKNHFIYSAAFSIRAMLFLSDHGTGSWPCPPQGWQREILFIVSHNPFTGPYFLNASNPYCEQVGV
jgi:hypothetical protein